MNIVKFIRSNFWILAGVLLMVDIFYSTYTFSNIPLDGDLGRVSAPVRLYEDVLNDPFGLKAISNNYKYGGAGRFFCHFSCQWWFKDFHHLLSKFIKNPVQRIFINSSLFVFFLQIVFVLAAYLYAKGKDTFSWKSFFPIAFLSSVFIQFGHFYHCMGIFDLSINYTFFYAFPLLMLAIYFYPFYRWHRSGGDYKVPIFWHLILPPLAVGLSFSGPLIQPVLFIIVLLYACWFILPLKKLNSKIHKPLVIQLAVFLSISVYAYYVSTYNSEANFSIPLLERYGLLLKGIGRLLTMTLAWPFLIISLLVSAWLVKKYEVIQWRKLRVLALFVFAFIGIYLFLLPLGGYRPYRPLIVRYDTFLPVTLGLLFLLFFMSYHLINNLELKIWRLYILFYLAVCSTFFLSDRKSQEGKNFCQKEYMHQMMSDTSALVQIPFNCNMLTWTAFDAKDQDQMTMINKCMHRWGFLKAQQRLQFTFPEDEF